ncbi:MAG: hypothetical protein K1X75_08995 [Leptospirales bacterium]|nr:hypothetical protein [Leptospirales bacterium]
MEEQQAQNGELDDFPALDDLDFKLDESPLSLDSQDDSGDDPFSLGTLHPLDEPAMGDDLNLEPHDEQLPALDDLAGDLSVDSSEPEQVAFSMDASEGADLPPELSILEGDGDESVSLSEDELENILGSTDDSFGEISEGDLRAEVSDEFADVPEVDLAPIAPASGELNPDEELGFDDFQSGAGATEELVIPELEESNGDGAGGIESELLSGDDDEPIALSADELDNILTDVEPTESADEFAMSDTSELPAVDFGEVDVGDDFSAPSFDADFGASEMEVGSDAETPAEAFAGLDAEEENITLSDDELSQVLLDGDLPAEISEELPAGMLDLDDNEPIALTPEELGNIVSEVGEGEVGLGDIEFAEQAPSLEFESGDQSELSQFSSMEEGPTALSDNELSSILEDTDAEGVQARAGLEDESAIAALEPPVDVINLDEYGETIEAGHGEAPPMRAAVAERVAVDSGVNKEELRKMISYLDGLFDQLPETAIREFSHSEYFDLYKRIMDELGL